MKKTVIVSAMFLAISGMAVSQAETVLDVSTPADTSVETVTEVQDASADALLDEPMAAQEETQPEEPPLTAPEESPQVAKLMALYPELIKRIEPYGKVCFEGGDCDITLTASGGSADGEPRDGKAVYEQVCQTCHGAGLLGSPVFGDAGAWAPRIAKGTETLYNNAINGINAMPAKGGADIPDEEVQNAVDYMIANAS